MALSDRDRTIFEDLTGQLEADDDVRQRSDRGDRRVTLIVTIAVGIVALPTALALDRYVVGLVGFTVAVAATERLLSQFPPPTSTWLREKGLLPRVAYVDRRSYNGTMARRRTYVLPGRLVTCVVLLPALYLGVMAAQNA